MAQVSTNFCESAKFPAVGGSANTIVLDKLKLKNQRKKLPEW